MDINMPKLNGIEATRSITAHYPHVAVVGVSAHADRFYQAAMSRPVLKASSLKRWLVYFSMGRLKPEWRIYRQCQTLPK